MKGIYKFTVTALAVAVMGFILIGCEDTTKPDLKLPAAPAGLVSTSQTETTITVAWYAVKEADKYHVYAGTTAGNLTLRGSPTSTSYLIEGLSANTTYYIAVSAENGAGEGNKSATITATTNQIPRPQAPTGLVSVTHAETSIAIAWNTVSGANKYHVYAGTVAGNLTLRGSPTSTSYLIEGLSANTTYYIAVSAESGAGEGNKSAAITVTTNQGVKPASPSGLTVGDITETSITVSWNNVSEVSSYNVFAGTTSAAMTLRGNPTTTNFTITGLVANTTYYIAVSARTTSNESDQSTPISTVTKPSAPTGLTAGTVTSDSIAVTWNSISGVSEYTVYAGTTSGTMTQRGTPTTASFNITGLTANTTYYVAVSASNDSGEGSQSSPMTVTTKLPVPTGFIATPQAASSSIQVSWNAVTGAASYKVYRSTSETGTYSLITTTSDTSYNDTDCAGFTWYYYKASAVTSSNSSLFTICDGTLTLYNNITLQGHRSNDASLVRLNNTDAKLVMNNGSKIINNTAIVDYYTDSQNAIGGGGVYAGNNQFTKTGGTIYGSNASPASLQNTAQDTNSGHAVYALVGNTILRRNTTAGIAVNLDSRYPGTAGGWE